MPILRFYGALASWIAKHFKVIVSVALISLAVGFTTDRFVGGRIAAIAGGIQAATLVFYLVLAMILLLFQRYKGRAGAFLGAVPVQYMSAFLCTAVTAFALLILYYLVRGVLINVS
jgi:hypothetical protein